MTRQQSDNAINKLHDLLDKQFCACIKAHFSNENYNRFDNGTDLGSANYEVSFAGTRGVYVIAVITNGNGSDLYEMHNDAAYIISEILEYQPTKIEII